MKKSAKLIQIKTFNLKRFSTHLIFHFRPTFFANFTFHKMKKVVQKCTISVVRGLKFSFANGHPIHNNNVTTLAQALTRLAHLYFRAKSALDKF